MIGSALRRVIAALLLAEALLSAAWIAGLMPSVPTREAVILVLVTLRGGVSALQLTAATLLFGRRPPGWRLARWALLASAALVTLEIGWRLSPSNIDPTFRSWFVAWYWVYALACGWYLKGRH